MKEGCLGSEKRRQPSRARRRRASYSIRDIRWLWQRRPIGAIFGGGQLGASAVAAGCGSLIGAVIWLAVGIGAWQLQPWAWILGLIGVAISVVSHVLGILQGESLFIGLLSLALPVIILIYLLSPGVRRAFGRG